MTDRARYDRLRAQFGVGDGSSDDGTDADATAVWNAFDLILDTDRFLNLGYSPWYLPHAVGSSQGRLARQLGRRIALRLGHSAGVPLLDVGCGRGGPSVVLAREFGYDVTGVDLVDHNVSRALSNAEEVGVEAAFLVGDAPQLPVATDSVRACVVVDAAPYVADKRGLVSELARVVEPGGVVAVSDLLRTDEVDSMAVERFIDAWDMAPLATLADYRDMVPDAGFVATRYEDVTDHSVGRFGFWADLFLALAGTPIGGAAESLLGDRGIDLDAVVGQVEATRPALPELRHYVVTARLES
ncbi:MAG: methyltransferase domain-containing protein [Haloarculaceae archaeon]